MYKDHKPNDAPFWWRGGVVKNSCDWDCDWVGLGSSWVSLGASWECLRASGEGLRSELGGPRSKLGGPQRQVGPGGVRALQGENIESAQ